MKSATIAALLFAAGCAVATAAVSPRAPSTPASAPAATQPATRSAAEASEMLKSLAAETFTTPSPKDFVRYERVKPVFKTKAIPKEHGDALIAALHGGAALRNRETPESLQIGLDGGCVLYPVPNIQIEAIRADGSRYPLAFTEDGSLVAITPDKYNTVVITEPASAEAKKALDTLYADLAAEYAAQPRPLTYAIWSGPDGGTLSGVSRLFYGRAGRWKDIYEANKAAIADPDHVRPGTKLIIPP